ncbi:MAG: pyridoxal 5'-phosphate synthase glutaminase subunit PdxT [Armatimonadetes bacterium]|nr:pyridoxal 5'-phosphate synthase glutaminase subunit PdxT [Armatimonadota bacterium]
MTVGVLALQGAFSEHLRMLQRCGVDAVEVRTVAHLDGVEGLILPGGESTTVGKLLCRGGLDEAIRQRVAQGMPLFGTCMGLILMAREIEGSDQFRLGLMDIAVRRNAFGRQVDSFECDLPVPSLGMPPVRAVFICAPYVTRVENGVQVLASVQGQTVLVRQGHLLGAAFHPELTEDTRIHRLFLDMVADSKSLSEKHGSGPECPSNRASSPHGCGTPSFSG